MLISSERHTTADIELWGDLVGADLMWANTSRFESKIERAKADIAEFIDSTQEWYVSVSWGKDSVAALHLVAQVSPRPASVYIKETPMANPYNDEVARHFEYLYPIDYSVHELDYSDEERLFHPDPTVDQKLWKSACRAVNKRGVRITGIRRQESGVRRIRFAMHGLRSRNTFAPIGYWTNDDVFAYLALNDLPTHPNYAMLGGGRWDRNNIRVDCIGGQEGDSFGRREWEREYYEDVLNRLAV